MATILVVDDNATNRELLLVLLGHDVHHILEAADGREGLEQARAGHPELVICDILMPTMDGYEFVRELRGMRGLANTPVIFWTAHYHGDKARVLAEACGVQTVLPKPCEPEVILSTVRAALGGEGKIATDITVPESFDRDHLRLVTDRLSRTTEQLSASNEQLSAIIRLNTKIASQQDPVHLLDDVCHGARAILGARYAYLLARDKTDHSSLHFVSAGLPGEQAAALPRPGLNAGVFGRVMEEGRSARLSLNNGRREQTGLPEEFPRAHALLAAPVASLQVRYGWICLCDKLGETNFNEEDEQLLVTMGRQLGRVYENGSLYVEVKKAADALQRESEQRQQALERLQESELHFRQLAENIREVFFLVDPALTKTLYVSPGYDVVWGRSREELYTRPGAWLEACHPDDRDTAEASLKQMRSRGEFDVTFRILRPDGELRWIHSRGFAIKNHDGKLYRTAGIAEDITESRMAEDRIRRLNQLYRVLSSINTLIVHADTQRKLFDRACEIAVQEGSMCMAWIGLVNAKTGLVVPQAWAGNEDGYLYHVQASTAPDHPGCHSATARALLENRAVVAQNIRDYQLKVPWLTEAVARGYESVAALPLRVSGQPAGVLVFFSQEPDYFDADEMKLLNELAGDISFAVENLRKREQLEFLSSYDVLTGLPNRKLFNSHLNYMLENFPRHGVGVALMIVDLKQLHHVNNAFGRDVGDALLVELGDRLRALSHDPANVGRVGEDSFGIILPSETDFATLGRRIQKELLPALTGRFPVDGHDIQVVVSAGVAVYPSDGTDADTLFANAEAAQKNALSSGAPLTFFEERMTGLIAETLQMEGRLRKALEDEEFVLFYQPKFESTTRKLCGFEALIRWQNPEQGLVSPGTFIHLLESSGLILATGTWAMKQALKDAESWRRAGLDVPRIAVNVSPVQLRDKTFTETVAEICAGYDSGECPLDLEITESLIMEDVRENIRKLNDVRRSGVRIYIDDFGTGYSSLGYLGRFPVDALKIDRSFIDTMTTQSENLTIVTSVIGLAHSLNLRVIAEGVETEEQARMLSQLECDELQGFLLGKPLPPGDIPGLLVPGKA